MRGYSPTSNMRCELHVLGCLFLRGCVCKSPARYFRRPYQFSVIAVGVCMLGVDMILCYESMPMMLGTVLRDNKKARFHGLSPMNTAIIHQPRAQHYLYRIRPIPLRDLPLHQ